MNPISRMAEIVDIFKTVHRDWSSRECYALAH
jgi:hypothetical protein